MLCNPDSRRALLHAFRLLELIHPPAEIRAIHTALETGSPDQIAAALDLLDTVLDYELKRLLLPLLDTSQDSVEAARSLFGINRMSAPETVRTLLHAGVEPRLVALTAAAAVDLRLQGSAGQLRPLLEHS